MRIKRTYKNASLKAGQVDYIDEAKAREVFNNTVTYNTTALPYGEVKLDAHASDEPIVALRKGNTVETFFSQFEIEEQDREPTIKNVKSIVEYTRSPAMASTGSLQNG